MKDITLFAEENLYLDKPIEGAFPLFDVLKLIMDCFGGNEFRLNKSKVYDPINFLAKAHGGVLLSSKSLFMFLINSLKSSWRNVRINAFDLLSRYDATYATFHDASFVNGILIPTAMDFLNDPRGSVSESAALMLKLSFTKCIDIVDLNLFLAEGGEANSISAEFESHVDKRLAFFKLILTMVKNRLQTFRTSLIAEGKTSALIHGLLAFFKHCFIDFKVGKQADLGEAKFALWRAFFKDMLHTSLEITRVCANLLANNRLTEDGKEAVDCRGHPIAQANHGGEGDEAIKDYDNLILVGVWLAVQENGETLQGLIKWSELPTNAED